MTTPRDRLQRLRAMLSTDDLVQMRDDPEGFAADPEPAADIAEGPVPMSSLRMGATPDGEPDGGMVRLAEVMQKFDDGEGYCQVVRWL